MGSRNLRWHCKSRSAHDPNYHFTIDMTNQAINWIQAQQSLTPDKPFYVYFSTGACHAPHHVPKEWADKYKGKFNEGWDKLREEIFAKQKQIGVIPQDAQLTPRPKEIPAWDTMNADQKRLLARQMEVYAGFAEQTDYEVGRLVRALSEMGELDKTLFIYIVGDNGSSAEGGPEGTYNEMMALNGIVGNASQMMDHIDDWGSPNTFPHDAKAKDRHTTQYFEMFGNRAIYHDGWVACTRHSIPWLMAQNPPLKDDVWELYNVAEDFSEANNLATKNPEKLKEMQDLFMKTAEKYHVLPIDDRRSERFDAATAGRPDLMGKRTSLTVYPGMIGLMENAFINTKNRSFTITADVDLPNRDANGVIICQAGRFGGWTLYMKAGKLHHEYNYFGLEHTNITSSKPIAAGKHVIKYEFVFDGGKPGAGGQSICP